MNKFVKMATTLAIAAIAALTLSACGPSAAELALLQARTELKTANDELEMLRPIAANVPSLVADLRAEIARKNQLAVENTRLLARVSQGQKDLGIVVGAGSKKIAAAKPAKPQKKV